jgi:uncharacterized membrane protein YtjA (UPF0391 family)
MLYYALMFLTVGLMASALNFLGVPGLRIQISWLLYFVGALLCAVHLFSKRPAGQAT